MSATVGGSMTNTELSQESSRFLKALWSKLDHGFTPPWEFRETTDGVLTYQDDKGEDHQVSLACWGGSIDIDRPSVQEPHLEDITEIFSLSFNHWVKKIIAQVTEDEECQGGFIYFRLHRGDRFEYFLHSFIHTEVTDLPLEAPHMAGLGRDIRDIKKPFTVDSPELVHPAPMMPPRRRYTAFMDVAFVPTWD